jgi:DNA repair protein RadD
MRVSYYVNNGLQKFEEYVCVEHDNYAGKKARDWMRARMPSRELPIPETTQRALEYAPNFKVPSAVKVWINKKYPEIMSFDWEENNVEVDVSSYGQPREEIASYEDDDIPF